MEVWNRAQQVEQLCSDLRGERAVLSALDFCAAAIGYYHNFTSTMGSSHSGFTSLVCVPVLHPLLYFYHVFLRKVRPHILADLTSHIRPCGSFLLRCDLKCNQRFQLASELTWSFHMHPEEYWEYRAPKEIWLCLKKNETVAVKHRMAVMNHTTGQEVIFIRHAHKRQLLERKVRRAAAI